LNAVGTHPRSSAFICGQFMLFVLVMLAVAAPVRAQQDTTVITIDLAVGRSFPITTAQAITRVSVATPDIADVIVVSEREVVINAKAPGETDAILWPTAGTRTHYRIRVHSPMERRQVALYVKFAEVRRDALRNLGVGVRYEDANVTVDAGSSLSGGGGTQQPQAESFLTLLTTLDTRNLLLTIDAAARQGNARLLAEPNLLAGNREEATFLAGGELPIPIVTNPGTGVAGSVQTITIVWREFGVRLRFVGEIVSDSLVKLTVRPEVSTLDYTNAVILSGFRVPALRTRRVESVIDVRRDESLVMSGMFNDEEERVRIGVPILKDLPVLGALFSSTRFQRNETELLVVVTPVVVDAMRPRTGSVVRIPPDSVLPARGALERRPPSDAPAGRRRWWWPW
jgi:pilus assembly protein CpaC